MATITIYLPKQEPLEIALDGYEHISLGRGPDNDVVLDDPSISGAHAIIQNLGGIFQVTDLGSTNGTFVNGGQVTELVLSHGSQILFGHIAAQFLDGDAALDAAMEMTATGDSGGYEGNAYGSGHHADIAETSARPAGYTNVSPIEKVVKKDTVATVAMVLGVLAVVAALALVTVAAMMKAA